MRRHFLFFAALLPLTDGFSIARPQQIRCRPVRMLLDDEAKILPESAPDGPGQAIGIVAELKGNAALIAAFSFGALSLPGTLTVSESKATGLGTAISTLTIEQGWYRYNPLSAQVLECRYNFECRGTSADAVNLTAATQWPLCFEGYSG